MDIFISNKNEELLDANIDIFCNCSKRLGFVNANYGDFFHIVTHPCRECADGAYYEKNKDYYDKVGEYDPDDKNSTLDMCGGTGKTWQKLCEEK